MILLDILLTDYTKLEYCNLWKRKNNSGNHQETSEVKKIDEPRENDSTLLDLAAKLITILIEDIFKKILNLKSSLTWMNTVVLWNSIQLRTTPQSFCLAFFQINVVVYFHSNQIIQILFYMVAPASLISTSSVQ